MGLGTRIELRTRHVVNTILSGEYHSAFKGQGVEFTEVREYQPGDDVRAIDWNVTARMGHPFVKIFEEERRAPGCRGAQGSRERRASARVSISSMEL